MLAASLATKQVAFEGRDTANGRNRTPESISRLIAQNQNIRNSANAQEI